MKRTLASLIGILAVVIAGPVAAQTPSQTLDCGTYRQVTCTGPFTDQAGLVDNDARVTIALETLAADSGNQVAVVIVDDVSPESTKEFANNLAEAWGVGSAQRNDGIVIVVAVAQRETWVTTGSGVSINETSVSDASVSFFRNGDFDGGVLAMLSALRDELGVSSAGNAEPRFEPTPDTGPAGLPRGVLWTAVGLAAALVGVGTASAISTGRAASPCTQEPDQRRPAHPRSDRCRAATARDVPNRGTTGRSDDNDRYRSRCVACAWRWIRYSRQTCAPCPMEHGPDRSSRHRSAPRGYRDTP
ncbi:MAG: TPM domain-containing protein [Actinobacteria bacterium]|nr:TPM domain-containing protein [Actinomycetota bacterium]